MQIPLAEWKAWAPGINSIDQWHNYLSGRIELETDSKPDISFLPPMFRRKLSPLARMIFQTLNQLECGESLTSAPIVFASRHGELKTSINLISSELTGAPFSPAGFSMSVHNSPAGLVSIHYKNQAPSTAVSAGKQTLQMSLIEAQAMLQTHTQCLLIYADLPIVEIYEEYKDEETFPLCLTLLLDKSSGMTLIPQEELTPLSLIRHLSDIKVK